MKKILSIAVLILNAASAFTQSISFSYDDLGRLTGAVYPDSSSIVYTYDAGGNRTSLLQRNPCDDLPRPTITASGTTTFCEGDSVTLTASSGDSYLWSTGDTSQIIVVNVEGAFLVLVTNANCGNASDSIKTTLLLNSTSAIEASFCENQTYILPDGLEVNIAGTYVSTIPSSIGCDSIITTNLIIIETIESEIGASICPGQVYQLPDGTSISESGTYQTTLTATNSCDSIVTVNLTIHELSTTIVSVNICSGVTYILPDGTTVSESGSYPVTLAASSGCDSIVITNLLVEEATAIEKEVTICTGQTFTLPDGTVVSEAGLYSVTLTSSEGCDSMINTTINVTDAFTTELQVSICEGQVHTLPDGTVVSEVGTYSVTILSPSGCDSTIITEVILLNSHSTEIAASICSGQSYTLPDGSTVSEAGMYEVALVSSSGCDSIVITNLTVSDVLTTTVQVSVCEGQPHALPDGTVVSESGIYPVTLVSASGCDSIVSTTLTILPIVNSEIQASICEGQNYVLPDGSQVSTAGTYQSTLTSASGCDSIVTVLLDIVAKYEVSIENSACEGNSVLLPDGTLASESGSFVVVLPSSTGCDSSITTVVSIYDLPAKPEISRSADTLISNYLTGNQWYLNGVLIPNATGQSLNITQTGSYSVEHTNSNGCKSMSDQLEVLSVSNNEVELGLESFIAFPNPNDGYFSIELLSSKGGEAILEIVNVLGQVVLSQPIPDIYGKHVLNPDLSKQEGGMYFVRLLYQDKIIIRKVTVQR